MRFDVFSKKQNTYVVCGVLFSKSALPRRLLLYSHTRVDLCVLNGESCAMRKSTGDHYPLFVISHVKIWAEWPMLVVSCAEACLVRREDHVDLLVCGASVDPAVSVVATSRTWCTAQG